MKAKIAILSAAVGAAAAAAALFGIYKYFVTPQRVVLLSAANMIEVSGNAFGYIDKNESDILRRYKETGGKTDLSFTVSSDTFTDGMPVRISSNSDGDCSVTDITLYDDYTFKIYKDDKQLLINTPLFDGGFSMPAKNLIKKWNGSVFSNIYTFSQNAETAELLKGFTDGSYSVSEFITDNDELAAAVNEIEIEENGKSKITIENKTENADVYILHISEEISENLIASLAEYICGTHTGSAMLSDAAVSDGISVSEEKQRLSDMLRSVLGGEYDITLKIKDLKIREADIKKGGTVHTIAFRGKKNIFSDIMIYKNGDVRNALRRVVTGSNGDFTDTVSLGDYNIYTADSSRNGVDISVGNSSDIIDIKASGKTIGDRMLSFSNVEINTGNGVSITGSAKFSNDYDTDFGFTKTGEYIDLLGITSEDLEAVSDTILTSLKELK